MSVRGRLHVYATGRLHVYATERNTTTRAQTTCKHATLVLKRHAGTQRSGVGVLGLGAHGAWNESTMEKPAPAESPTPHTPQSETHQSTPHPGPTQGGRSRIAVAVVRANASRARHGARRQQRAQGRPLTGVASHDLAILTSEGGGKGAQGDDLEEHLSEQSWRFGQSWHASSWTYHSIPCYINTRCRRTCRRTWCSASWTRTSS